MKKRLQLIINWIEKNQQWLTIADIGTDHGKIPLYLDGKHTNLNIYATDIVKSTIESLNQKIGQPTSIKTFCGFGLNPLQNKELDVCIVAGMGTAKMLKIIKLDSHLQHNYIFQTIQNPIEIREWVKKNDYYIKAENILQEKEYFYHTLLVSKTKGQKINNEKECYFGPLLLEEKNQTFLDYWKNTLNFKKSIMQNNAFIFKKHKFKQDIKWIKEVIENN